MPDQSVGGVGVRGARGVWSGPEPTGRRLTGVGGAVGGSACAVSVAITDSDVRRMSGVLKGTGENVGVCAMVGSAGGVAAVGVGN